MNAFVSYDGGQDGKEKECRSPGPSGHAEQEIDSRTTAGDCQEGCKSPVGTIYILETEDRQFIKIGYTARLMMRIAQHAALIRKTGGDVRMIGFFPGTFRTEARIHAYLADCRYKSEWYQRDAALEKLIGLFDEPRRIEKTTPASYSEVFSTLGRKGGPARAKKLTAAQRKEIAKQAAQARWGKKA